jgi:hypothetical protein
MRITSFSGDHHLFDLRRYRNIRILTPAELSARSESIHTRRPTRLRVLAGRLSTTIHITVDAPGNSAGLVLTGVEEVADITQARSQIEGLRTEAMIGNKGCDAEQLKKFCRMSTRHDT